MFRALNDPFPSEETQGSLLGGGARRETAQGIAARPSAHRRVPSRRRVHRTLRHVDPLSVLKISLIVYTVLLLAWLLFVAIFYNFLEGLGLFDTINSALRGFAYDEVEVSLGVVERWALIAGIVLTIFGSVLNVFLALLYNLIARYLGGVEVSFEERDL